MPTYVYETIPENETDKPVEFEYWQQMSDKPLTQHPDTGEPVRRVLTAGLLVVSNKGSCCKSKCSCR